MVAGALQMQERRSAVIMESESRHDGGSSSRCEHSKPHRDHYKQSVVLQRELGELGSDDQQKNPTNPNPLMLRRRSLTIAHLYLSSAALSRTRTQSLTRTVSTQTLLGERGVGGGGGGGGHSETEGEPGFGSSRASMDDARTSSAFDAVAKTRPKSEYHSLSASGAAAASGVDDSRTSSGAFETVAAAQTRPKSEYYPSRARSESRCIEEPGTYHQQPFSTRTTTATVMGRRRRKGEKDEDDEKEEEGRFSPEARPSRPRLKTDRPRSEMMPHQSRGRTPVLDYRDVVVRDGDSRRIVPRLARPSRTQRHQGPTGPHGPRSSSVSSSSTSSSFSSSTSTTTPGQTVSPSAGAALLLPNRPRSRSRKL